MSLAVSLPDLGFVATVAVVLVAMVATVLVVSRLEDSGYPGRRRSLRPPTPTPAPVPVPAPDPEPPAPAEGPFSVDVPPTDAPVTDAPVTEDGVVVAVVRRPDGPSAVIGPSGAETDLAGVLFAAYVAAGGPEASRASGWVASLGAPPGLPGLRPGVSFRGRPERVRQLLEATEDGRNRVTLHPRVDISRGIRSRPPQDPTLAGLLHWWRATEEDGSLGPAAASELASSIRTVAAGLEGHPLGPAAAALVRVGEDAGRTGAEVGLVVRQRRLRQAPPGPEVGSPT